jgi:hypothetical protein
MSKQYIFLMCMGIHKLMYTLQKPKKYILVENS